ncbi:MAG: YihA family ribosome biogenesis GTP-binding protein [Ignavibacteriae bacterium]|nr:YihA family ribosome biogenesis GTP-binding protein [Ignavibacteriota bacterium]
MLDIKFTKSIFEIKNLPNEPIPEVVLCGRSNVGKSTFINSLSKQKNVAKTSSTPGKTRSVNYYLTENKFHFVDLPGYGYAKISVSEKVKWQKLIHEYLTRSKNISLAFHLIDSRHKPTDLDILLNRLLNESEIPYVVLLSKVDKLSQAEKSKSIKITKDIFPELNLGDNLFLYSSLKKIGKKEVEIRLSKLFL